MALCYSKESQWMMILRIKLLVAFQTWMKTTQSRNPHLQWVGDLWVHWDDCRIRLHDIADDLAVIAAAEAISALSTALFVVHVKWHLGVEQPSSWASQSEMQTSRLHRSLSSSTDLTEHPTTRHIKLSVPGSGATPTTSSPAWHNLTSAKRGCTLQSLTNAADYSLRDSAQNPDAVTISLIT